MGRVVRNPYPHSEESDDDVIHAEEYESELQQINLRNEAPNQITVDTCGERCAQLDDFNCFLPTDKRDEKSDTPESEIDTSESENGVYLSASDSSPSQTDTATQRLLGPPVVAQTRPKGGCQAAMPSPPPPIAPATGCPDGGQYCSGGYKTRVRRLMYSWF